MAAAQAALNNYLDNVLGINAPGATAALNMQGLTSFDDFLSLIEDDVADVCSNVRKPGGTIPNPNYNPANPIPGVPQVLSNPGIQFGHIYEKRLKMLRYYCHHMQRIQRAFTANHATIARITNCYRMKDAEDDAEDIDFPQKLTKIEQVRDVLEDMDNYLVRKLGSSGVPLAYVTREDVAVPLVDPGYGLPTPNEEMISRAPHVGIYYQQDNKDIWQMIRHVTHGGPGWSWVQAHQRACDGRQAYLAIKAHYLGESYSARIRAQADNIIETSYYDGKSRSFTFERYCEVLKSAFTDIETTGEEVSETRKVRVLLHGIQDTRLSHAKSQVLATPALKATFETALNFIAQFQEEKRSYDTASRGPTRNVSSINRSGPNSTSNRTRDTKYHNKKNPNLKVTDKYYKYEDWINLTEDPKAKVRELKAKRLEKTKRKAAPTTSDRNVKPKEDSEQKPPSNSEIGAIMSSRKPASRSL
jgi:hypothetical protein